MDAVNDFDLALDAVRRANLPHPDGQLLECFLEESVNHDVAAGYMIQKCLAVGNTQTASLAAFVSDWKRLISACEFPCMLSEAACLPIVVIREDPPCPTSDKRMAAEVAQRDGGTCFLTGRGNSFWDPLGAYPIFPTFTKEIDPVRVNV